MEEVNHDRIQAASLFFNSLLEPDVNEELLFDDQLLVAAAADNSWSRRRTVTLKEISDGPWAIPYHDTRDWADDH